MTNLDHRFLGREVRRQRLGIARLRRAVGMATLAILVPIAAAAQDMVTIATGDAGGQAKLSGKIVDYDGRQLRITLAGGVERAFPTEKVVRVETQYTKHHVDADVALAGGRFKEALALYEKALKSEPRRWVRRQIIADWVRCDRALGRPDRAGEAFLLLVLDDPDTRDFDCIPLAWLPRQPTRGVEQTARQWIERKEPAAMLLGASHLLTTGERRAALAKLRALAAGSDRRVAQLAMAQLWRRALTSANQREVENWQRAVEQIPEPLQAGPYFVLGRALLRQKQWEQAALAFLRVAILHPDQRGLAAQALVDAGRAMEQLDRTGKALRLYRDLIATYPDQAQPVAEARTRAEQITRQGKPTLKDEG